MPNCTPIEVKRTAEGGTVWRCSGCGFSDTDRHGHFPNKIHRSCPALDAQPIDEAQRPPGWLVRAKNFSIALVRHVANGMAECSQADIDTRFAQCRACRFFDGEVCTHARCGCNASGQKKFLNKLAWSSESCPIGKWSALTPVATSETEATSQPQQ